MVLARLFGTRRVPRAAWRSTGYNRDVNELYHSYIKTTEKVKCGAISCGAIFGRVVYHMPSIPLFVRIKDMSFGYALVVTCIKKHSNILKNIGMSY